MEPGVESAPSLEFGLRQAKARLRSMVATSKSISDDLSLKSSSRVPLVHLGLDGRYDVKATAKGGGITGQAGAIRLGISRALLEIDTELKKELRGGGYLTRDSRIKESKKYGRKKARRGFQFVKR